MSALAEVLKLESQHPQQDESLFTIHLFPEGTFFRAYEWSAWLVVTHIKDFKVTRREIKAVGRDVCYIGFPQESLEKWTPEHAVVSDRTDGGKDLQIPAQTRREYADTTAMKADFEHWRGSLPISEFKESASKAKTRPQQGEPECDLTARELMLKVLAYPVEKKTPLETMDFVTQVKTQIAKILSSSQT